MVSFCTVFSESLAQNRSKSLSRTSLFFFFLSHSLHRHAQATTSSSKRSFSTTPQEWSARLSSAKVSKHDLNALVANYLFTEGYLDAATQFAREASLNLSSEHEPHLESIKVRRDIRSCVQRGQVQQALDKVVELDPEILEHNPSLHFSLLQQHLIELIRQQRIPEALEFAQQELAPRGEEHPKFLVELEKTMALLAFEMPSFTTSTSLPVASSSSSATLQIPIPQPSASSSSSKKSKKSSTSSTPNPDSLPPMPPALSSLLDPSHRLETCLLLNNAILTSQNEDPEPKLPKLMGVLNWGEGVLKEKGGEWPRWDLREELEKTVGGGEREKKEEEEGDTIMF
ncbi:LisH and CLTH domain-containing protein [Sporobolomyces salmoneus]|uniref:LisH and CLTH domain-containing protein n=1 Tax=Sporobolomyces salmoneus TaxID=183962 RepID=UPI0031705F0A